jgi:hypothetical protein
MASRVKNEAPLLQLDGTYNIASHPFGSHVAPALLA